MNFPIYDISESSWDFNEVKQHNILYENPYWGIVPRNKSLFEKQIQNFEFVDSKGQLFNVIGFNIIYKKGLLRFFAIRHKIELIFIKSTEKYSLIKFKELLNKRAIETQNSQLEQLVQKAKSFEDILQQISNNKGYRMSK
jgi:hypothetical protein